MCVVESIIELYVIMYFIVRFCGEASSVSYKRESLFTNYKSSQVKCLV